MTLLQPTRPLLALLCLLTAGSLAQAQQIHRIVGPDGRVTFSDRAPDKPGAATMPAAGAPSAPAGNDALPYELRQIASRFPVTLYTGANCAPCVSARNLLINRGVPFTERTVSSNEDIDALERLSGNTGLPFGTIGNQQLQGFSDAEWSQYLDAAGYPKQSRLPANYRRSAATPLTVARPPAASAPASAASEAGDAPSPRATPRARPAPEPATGPSPSNPAGIRF